MDDRIDQIKKVIEQKTGSKASHVESVSVVEIFRKKIIWEGVVETFDLASNPKAKRCYAWMYVENNETHYVAALAVPPVNSAIMAVKMYIASMVRNRNDRGVDIYEYALGLHP